MEIRHFFPRRIKRVQQRNSNKHNYYFLFSFIHPSSIHSPTKNIDSVLLPTFPFPSSSTSYSPLVPLALLPVLSAVIVPNGAPCRRWKKKNVDFSCWCQRVLCRCHFDDDEGGAADEQGAAQLQTSNNSRPWLDAVAPLPCRAIHLNERGALIGPDRHRPLHPTEKEKKNLLRAHTHCRCSGAALG